MEPNSEGMRRSTRYWTHRLAEDEVERYIPGTGKRKFKKDSRTWLHKSSKNFKTVTGKDVPPEAQSTPDKKCQELDKHSPPAKCPVVGQTANGEGEETVITDIKIPDTGYNITKSHPTKQMHEPNEKIAPDVTKSSSNGAIILPDKEVRQCLDDAIQAIEVGPKQGTNKTTANLMKTEQVEMKQHKFTLCDTANSHAELAKTGLIKGIVLSDSELCLRATKLALTHESDPGKDTPNTLPNGFAIATEASSNSSQEKNSSKAVTKNLKKLSIGPKRKRSGAKLMKAARKWQATKNRTTVCKNLKKNTEQKLTKLRAKSCTNTPVIVCGKQKRAKPGKGKSKSRIPSLTKSSDIRTYKKEGKVRITKKEQSKKHKAKRFPAVQKPEANGRFESNLKSEMENPSDISVSRSLPGVEGHSTEDKLHGKHPSNTILSALECRSGKNTHADKDVTKLLPTPKFRIRKRKSTLLVNKSTSSSSIQEKRSRDSLCEDNKTSVSKRDRRPPRYKSVETSLPGGLIVTDQSCSASSLQVQCSTTQGSLEDADSCPSSTVVEQGSDSSITVSTPRGCLSCPWIISQDCLNESESGIYKDSFSADHCMLAPSPGNHCLPTINMANLNERLDSKFEESAHILHRTKALLCQQFLGESWELVSKSDTALLNDVKFAWE